VPGARVSAGHEDEDEDEYEHDAGPWSSPVLRLSKKADYALIAMRHLALRPDAGAASAREIAEQFDIPTELLAKVLQRLVRQQLLTSHQGTRGGYVLARPAVHISVADVIQAIDGPVAVTACASDGEPCEQYDKCSIRDPLWRIKERILRALADCSLQELASETDPHAAARSIPLHARH
jgi:Rrf2 family protein